MMGEAHSMTETMKGLLLEDRWAPVTSEMGFLEARAEHAARFFGDWQAGLNAPRGIAVRVRPVSGSLEQVLSSLLPLSGREIKRHLFISTRSSWTAYVDNSYRGTDASSAMGYMARAVGCRGLRVVAQPNTIRDDKGRYGAVMIEVYGPNRTSWLNHVRAVSASNDGGRWVFDEFGEPFPFEKVEQYQARKVKDRFTLDMLKQFLNHMGLSPFEEDFYLPEGSPAWLVEKTGGVFDGYEEYTLAQARENF
jgi:hypothetical protein